jgi:hypothetical protein
MFQTAGLLLFIGAILTIFFGLGLLLMLIAWILSAIAFFSIKAPQQLPYPAPPSTAPSQTATRHCQNCGAPIQPYVNFCPNCGKKLPT